jgi:hypothetical protein
VKHVFVETNFIVEVVRPHPAPDAVRLLDRADVELHLPWVSIVEAKRTLVGIVNDDLGFDGELKSFAGREFLAGRLTALEKPVVDRLAKQLAEQRKQALSGISAAVDAAVKRMSVIEPSKRVVEKTLELYPLKALPPFDEMVLGAVLAKAQELFDSGERDFYFCNLNTKDFDTPSLREEYRSLSVMYKTSFQVP